MSANTWLRLLGLPCLLIAAGLAVPALTDTPKGKKHALLIGVTGYDHSAFPTLKYTENDVEKLHDILTSKSGGFDSVRVLSHTRGKKSGKDKPTAENIRAAIEDLLAGKTRHDTVMIALSGHGATVTVEDPDDKAKPKTFPFFCPSNADLRKISYSSGKSKTLLNLDHFFDELKTCGAGVKLVLMDACRNEMKAQSATRNLDVATVTVPRNVAALFSCSEDEKAWENETLKHGVFFHFVLKGLRGEAKNKDGAVTWSRLSEYVRNRVTKEVGTIVGDGARQTPHEVGNVRGASPILVRVDAKDEVPGKDKDGGKSVVDSPKDKTGKEPIVKGFLDKDGKNSIGMKFVLVKKGKFTMGSPKDEKDRNTAEDEHEVEITKDFYLGVYEVTQGQWKAVMGFNPSYFSHDGKRAEEDGTYYSEPGGGKEKVKEFTQKELDDFPVETVSWEDAQTFLKKLNARVAEKEKGRVYRLPTEAEWEYAARGGASSSNKPFHFKQATDALSSIQANFDGKHPYGGAAKGKCLARTSKVGSYEPNALGLYDMHGNVYEWCNDWYGAKYYQDKDSRKDPQGPQEGGHRVLRGGSWGSRGGGWGSDGGHICRAAYRGTGVPGNCISNHGFRVVCGALPQD